MKIKPTINIYTDPTTILYIDNEYEVDGDLATSLSNEGYCLIVAEVEEPKQRKSKQLDEKSA